jgi:hypothetical protein
VLVPDFTGPAPFFALSGGDSMSFAYLPLYTGDYIRDTRHLTPLRHGIYLLTTAS